MYKQFICPNCLTQGIPKKVVKGSILVEIALWICFLLPGLIYSLWRSTSAARYKVCRTCGEPGVIPLNSPRAKQILAELEKRAGEDETSPELQVNAISEPEADQKNGQPNVYIIPE